MILRVRETGMLSVEEAADSGATVVEGLPANSMSFLIIRPPGPDPPDALEIDVPQLRDLFRQGGRVGRRDRA